MSPSREPALNCGASYAPGIMDQCWALPFLVACVTLMFTLPCTSGGLFYVLFMDKFGVDRKTATWTKTITWATSYIMGFAIGAIQDKVYIYSMILVGALLCPLAMIASAFAPDMAWMCVTFGFLYGASYGILGISTSLYVVSYFDKYRSFATGIQHSGMSLSGAFGPYFLSILAVAYGLQGTFILTCGVSLHLIPLAILLRRPRPIGWPRCAPWKAKRISDVISAAIGRSATKTSFDPPERNCAEHAIHLSVHENTGKQPKVGASQHPHFSEEIVPLDSCSQSDVRDRHIEHVQEEPQKSSGVLSLSLDLLRAPSFYVIVVPIIVADFTLPLLATTLIDYTGDKGVPRDTAALLLSCLSVGTFAGRLVIPFLSDKATRNRCIAASVTFVLASLCFAVLPHIYGSGVIAVVTIFAGVLQGYLATIKSVLVADYLGVRNLAVSWGLIGLVSLPLTLCEPFIVGAFRDFGGSYDNLYRSCGAASIVAALLLLMQAHLDAKKRMVVHTRLPRLA